MLDLSDEVAASLAEADKKRLPIDDTTAYAVAAAVKLDLWRSGIYAPEELTKFVLDGSFITHRFMAMIADVRLLMRCQYGMPALSALAGYARYNRSYSLGRGAVSPWPPRD